MPEPRLTPGCYFSIEIQDVVVGHFAECSGLELEWEVMPYAEGGQNAFVHQLRGRITYPNLVLKRGITDDEAFTRWLLGTKKREERGTITVKLLDSRAQTLRSWAFAGACPVKWRGPTLASGSANLAVETLEIAHEGLVPA